jgi:hypothetical protein
LLPSMRTTPPPTVRRGLPVCASAFREDAG